MGGVNLFSDVYAKHIVHGGELPVYFPIKGIDILDDNSGTLKGTWNSDETIKTVTRSTADLSHNVSQGFDLILWPLSAIKWYDGSSLNLTKQDISVRVVTDNKKILIGNFSNCQDDSKYGVGYWFGAFRRPNFCTTSGFNSNIDCSLFQEVVNDPTLANGTYEIYISFKYQGKTYTCKKTLILAY